MCVWIAVATPLVGVLSCSCENIKNNMDTHKGRRYCIGTNVIKESKEMPVAEPKTQVTSRETFNRPPRIWPSFPQGKVNIPAPPAREALPPKQSNITLIIPLVMMGLMVGIYYLAGQRSPQQ